MNIESVDYLSGNRYIWCGKLKLMQKKQVYVETYGCQMNVADSEVVLSIMNDNGYGITHSAGNADVIFVNTCSVRDNAEQRVRQRIST